MLHMLIIKRLNGSLGLNPGEGIGAKEAHWDRTQPGRFFPVRNVWIRHVQYLQPAKCCRLPLASHYHQTTLHTLTGFQTCKDGDMLEGFTPSRMDAACQRGVDSYFMMLQQDTIFASCVSHTLSTVKPYIPNAHRPNHRHILCVAQTEVLLMYLSRPPRVACQLSPDHLARWGGFQDLRHLIKAIISCHSGLHMLSVCSRT